MAWEFSVLVVANETASSDELLDALRERSEAGACRFTLVMPGTGGDRQPRLEAALERMREAAGAPGVPTEPVGPAAASWKLRSGGGGTGPAGVQWSGAVLDLPHRLEKLTSVPVRHVVSHPPRPEVQTEPVPEKPRYGVLAAFAAVITRR